MDLYDKLILDLRDDPEHWARMEPSGVSVEEIRAAFVTTPDDTAAICEVSTRTLTRWEKRGLPAIGRGHGKRYCWPHTCWWLGAWEARQRMGDTPQTITMAEAEGWHLLRVSAQCFAAAGVVPPWTGRVPR